MATTTTTTTTHGGTVGDPATGTSMALKKLRAPEMFPRGSSGDPQLEDLRGRLQDNADITQLTINNIITNTTKNTSVNIGTGGLDNTCRVIATTTPGLSLLGNRTTGGNDTLKLTADGQLIFCWLERSAGNTNTFFAKKSVSPYLIWTSLDGTTQDATQIVQTVGLLTRDEPVWCEDKLTGSLHFAYYAQNGANFEVRDMVLPRDSAGTGWTAGAYVLICQSNASTTVQRASPLILLGDMISATSGVYFVCRQGMADIGHVFRFAGNVWRGVARYYNPLGSFSALDGDQKRLVDIGDGRILVLMEASDGTRPQINYSILDESTAAYDPALGEQPRTNATGYFLTAATSNILISGFGGPSFCTWSAARIAGTSRIGVTYIGATLAASGSQPAGSRYTEFDGVTNTWTAQATIVMLSQADVDLIGGTPRTLSTVVGFTGYDNNGGRCVFGGSGYPRTLWLQGSTRGADGSHINGIAYRRLVAGGTHTAGTDWYALREVHSFGGMLSLDNSRKGEFQGARDLVTVEGVTYAPVMWTRAQGNISANVGVNEFCFKLLPVALMDLP